jgi:hypothetical protein
LSSVDLSLLFNYGSERWGFRLDLPIGPKTRVIHHLEHCTWV